MHPYAAIGGAIMIFLLTITVLAAAVISSFALFFHFRKLMLDRRRRKIMERWGNEAQSTVNVMTERRVLEIVPEELYAVSKEEYEADMMNEGPQSPLSGYDAEKAIDKQLPNNPWSFFNPAQN